MDSLLSIISSQRERFRARNQELEAVSHICPSLLYSWHLGTLRGQWVWGVTLRSTTALGTHWTAALCDSQVLHFVFLAKHGVQLSCTFGGL